MLTRNNSTIVNSWLEKVKQQPEQGALCTKDNYGSDHFNHSRNLEHCINAALTDPFATFLAKIPGYVNPVTIHRITEVRDTSVGATIGTKLHGALIGSSVPALGMRVDLAQLFSPIDPAERIDFEATWTTTDPTEFKAIGTDPNAPAPGTASPKMEDLRNVMYIPRFIASHILACDGSTTAPELAVEILSLLRSRQSISIDATSADANFTTDKDELPKEFEPLMQWLHSFDTTTGASMIAPISPSVVLKCSPLYQTFEEIHQKHFPHLFGSSNHLPGAIGPDASINSIPHAPFTEQQLAQLIETNSHMSKIAGSLERSGQSKRGFDKIPSIVQETLLIAGTTDGICKAEDMSPKGREIFSARSDRDGALLLVNALHRAGHYYAKFSPAQAKSICSGFWGWDGTNPSGISMLLFCPYNPTDDYSLRKESLILHLKTSHTMDSVSLKQLTESDVVIPDTSQKVVQVLALKRGIWNLFFPECLVERNLETVIAFVQRYTRDFERLAANDHEFIAKFLCSIDSRINKWLEMCSLHRDGNDLRPLDNSIIDFDDIVSSIIRGSFSYGALPTCILRLKSEDNAQPSATPITPNTDKKRKREDINKVHNESPNPDWTIRPGENYAEVFACTEVMSDRPEGVCARFQIKKYCFSNCKHPHGTISGAKASEFDKFVKKARRIASPSS